MNYQHIYHRAYQLLQNTTPLTVDCGKLCGSKCCEGEDVGMYLFPYEDKILEQNSHFTIEDTDFIYGGISSKILFCDGKCNRDFRPLSCRIFPLVPHYKNGKMEIIIDPRAKAICPLSHMDLDTFDGVFVMNVKRAMNIIMKFKQGREYIKELSNIIDEYEEMVSKFRE